MFQNVYSRSYFQIQHWILVAKLVTVLLASCDYPSVYIHVILAYTLTLIALQTYTKHINRQHFRQKHRTNHGTNSGTNSGSNPGTNSGTNHVNHFSKRPARLGTPCKGINGEHLPSVQVNGVNRHKKEIEELGMINRSQIEADDTDTIRWRKLKISGGDIQVVAKNNIG